MPATANRKGMVYKVPPSQHAACGTAVFGVLPFSPMHPCAPACPPAVLRRKNSYVLSLWMLPLFAFLTVWIGCF